jgi:hypothetical protein
VETTLILISNGWGGLTSTSSITNASPAPHATAAVCLFHKQQMDIVILWYIHIKTESKKVIIMVTGLTFAGYDLRDWWCHVQCCCLRRWRRTKKQLKSRELQLLMLLLLVVGGGIYHSLSFFFLNFQYNQKMNYKFDVKYQILLRIFFFKFF